MTLFTRSCHGDGPNGRFTLSFAGSVFGTELMPYFVNSTSLVSKSVIRCYITVNFKVKVNLGQSSCYFDGDLRSIFKLDLPRSKSICFDASWRGPWYIRIRVSYIPNYKTAISDKITCWEGEQFPLSICECYWWVVNCSSWICVWLYCYLEWVLLVMSLQYLNGWYLYGSLQIALYMYGMKPVVWI